MYSFAISLLLEGQTCISVSNVMSRRLPSLLRSLPIENKLAFFYTVLESNFWFLLKNKYKNKKHKQNKKSKKNILSKFSNDSLLFKLSGLFEISLFLSSKQKKRSLFLISHTFRSSTSTSLPFSEIMFLNQIDLSLFSLLKSHSSMTNVFICDDLFWFNA